MALFLRWRLRLIPTMVRRCILQNTSQAGACDLWVPPDKSEVQLRARILMTSLKRGHKGSWMLLGSAYSESLLFGTRSTNICLITPCAQRKAGLVGELGSVRIQVPFLSVSYGPMGILTPSATESAKRSHFSASSRRYSTLA